MRFKRFVLVLVVFLSLAVVTQAQLTYTKTVQVETFCGKQEGVDLYSNWVYTDSFGTHSFGGTSEYIAPVSENLGGKIVTCPGTNETTSFNSISTDNLYHVYVTGTVRQRPGARLCQSEVRHLGCHVRATGRGRELRLLRHDGIRRQHVDHLQFDLDKLYRERLDYRGELRRWTGSDHRRQWRGLRDQNRRAVAIPRRTRKFQDHHHQQAGHYDAEDPRSSQRIQPHRPRLRHRLALAQSRRDILSSCNEHSDLGDRYLDGVCL